MKFIERQYTPNPQDGTSTWQVLPYEDIAYDTNGLGSVDCEVIVGSTSYDVKISSEDGELLDNVAEYHETNNRFLPPATRKAPGQLAVVYSTEKDLEVDQDTILSMGNNPYVAGITKDGSHVVATGKPSVGTLKSIVFGAVSTLACRDTEKAPLHASIGTYDGVNAFCVSGRGNWGKTTNMIGAKIADPELKVITDDWSLIDTVTGKIEPIDMLVAIRPEAVPGISEAIGSCRTPDYLTTARKDGGRLFSVYDIFGEGADEANLRLGKVLFADKDPENVSARPFVYSPTHLNTSWRLMDDAYHSPDIDTEYQEKYRALLKNINEGAICTVMPDHLRADQLAEIVRFFRG